VRRGRAGHDKGDVTQVAAMRAVVLGSCAISILPLAIGHEADSAAVLKSAPCSTAGRMRTGKRGSGRISVFLSEWMARVVISLDEAVIMNLE
jgi:hypothetical protein